MVEVISVVPEDDYKLLLNFDTGELRRFDMKPYLHYPVYRRLENKVFFELTQVQYGTVTWPGEIDIAPETLYEKSVLVDEAKTGFVSSGGETH